jgi:hypothetical protein
MQQETSYLVLNFDEVWRMLCSPVLARFVKSQSVFVRTSAFLAETRIGMTTFTASALRIATLFSSVSSQCQAIEFNQPSSAMFDKAQEDNI